jgi:hypothetical protein
MKTPEDRDRVRRALEEGEEARRNLQEILERVEARLQARREEWLNRPRGLRRLLFWSRS